ncbi:MAG TPA: tetratricopeptide repeat protein [Polyangia bacterium]
MRAAFLLLATFAVVAFARPAVADPLDELARAIEAHPDDAKAYDAYALAAFKTKRYDDAIHELKIGVARIPDYGEGYYKLAYAFRQKREWADAADYYRRYIALHPEKTDPYFGLGASLEGLGDKAGAIAAYQKYIALETSPAKARFVAEAKTELARLEGARTPATASAHEPARATPAAHEAASPAVTPSATAPRADAANLKADADRLRQAGKLDEAVGAYQKAIEADPGNVELKNDLGSVYFGLKRYPEAAQSFQNAVTRDPNFALGWYNLAHALRKSGQRAEAATAYRRYIKLRPDDPDPYYGLAQALKAEGDVPGAIDAFRRYIAMEKRPDEQRWVDKAKAELEVLESMQKSQPAAPVPHSDARSPKLGQDAFAGDELMNPFAQDDARIDQRELRDPFAARQGSELARAGGDASRGKLREYGRALLAFRRALARHAADVTERYERGIGFALADDAPAALRAWNGVALEDSRVNDALRGVEQVRRRLLADR